MNYQNNKTTTEKHRKLEVKFAFFCTLMQMNRFKVNLNVSLNDSICELIDFN